MKLHPKVQVTVGTSGTGGGFKKFTVGETDVSDASRPIADTEIAACRENNIEYVELKVAIDGLSVVVNPENDWCDCLNVEQLRELWKPGSSVNTWRDLNPDWPADEIKLFGPDTDSGTFDYFTEVIVGKTGESRADYEPSVNDNVLVRGVAGERNALGYFGYAYYVENQDKLKVLGIAPTADSACVKPGPATIEAGEYVPLARPLFLYVNRKALARPEVAEFLRYYLDEGQELVTERGYIKLSAPVLEEVHQTFESAVGDGSSSPTKAASSGG